MSAKGKRIRTGAAVLAIGIALLGATYDRQEVWEYRVVHGPLTDHALSQVGAEGWELVAVTQTIRSYAGTARRDLDGDYRTQHTADATVSAVFKRRARN